MIYLFNETIQKWNTDFLNSTKTEFKIHDINKIQWQNKVSKKCYYISPCETCCSSKNLKKIAYFHNSIKTDFSEADVTKYDL